MDQAVSGPVVLDLVVIGPVPAVVRADLTEREHERKGCPERERHDDQQQPAIDVHRSTRAQLPLAWVGCRRRARWAVDESSTSG